MREFVCRCPAPEGIIVACPGNARDARGGHAPVRGTSSSKLIMLDARVLKTYTSRKTHVEQSARLHRLCTLDKATMRLTRVWTRDLLAWDFNMSPLE